MAADLRRAIRANRVSGGPGKNMIKRRSCTKVTTRAAEDGSDSPPAPPTPTFSHPPPPFIFQTTAVVGVALSCFKVKVPFIVAIKQEQPWENERARMPGESAGRRGGGREEKRYGEIREERGADGTTVQPDALITLKLR